MKAKKSIFFIIIAGLLTLCSLPVKAQFEFGPTVSAGVVFDNKSIMGAGFSSDLGLSARYTFFKDAPLSLQVRLDAIYGYIYAGSVHKNLLQHVRFTGSEDDFAFVWQDHLIRVPLTVGIRFNHLFENSPVAFRLGGYYGRGIAGKARYFRGPSELGFIDEFDSYKSNTIKGVKGYEGNFISLAQNEHRLGVVAAIDVSLSKKLDLSIHYMGDILDSWDWESKPYVTPSAIKLALSYWF